MKLMRTVFLIMALFGGIDAIGAPVSPRNGGALETVHFFVNSAQLRPASKIKLDQAAAALNSKFPHAQIEIAGHCDETGNEEINFKLSRERAQVVLDYLLTQGVESKRLFSKGYGAELPVADNGTERGREQNRRVEVRFAHEPGPGDFH